MCEGKQGFLRSGPHSSTTKSAKQTILFMLRGGSWLWLNRLVELEVAESLAAMQNEDFFEGPISKVAKKAVKKAEEELWQALESLDLKDAREAANEIAKKKKEQKVINNKSKSCHKITEFF